MSMDNSTGSDPLTRGFEVMRGNSVPLALIGIGVAWLIAANTMPKGGLAEARGKITGMAAGVGATAGDLASGIAGKVGRWGAAAANGALGYTGNPLVDEMSGSRPTRWLHQMVDKTQGAWRSASASSGAMLQRVGSVAGDRASRVTSRLSAAGQRNPLMVGAAGIIAGALVGALLSLRNGDTRLLPQSAWRRGATATKEAIARVREAASQS